MSSPDLCSCSATAAARYSLLTSLSSVGLTCYYDSNKIYWSCTNSGNRVIAINLSDAKPDNFKSRDWSSFDAFAATVADVTKVILAFETKEDMNDFTQDVLEPHMPHIRTQFSVEYIIGRPKTWRGEGGFVPANSGPGALTLVAPACSNRC